MNRAVIALGVARMADAVANSFLVIVLPLYIASGQVTGTSFGLSDRAGKPRGFVLGSLLVWSQVQELTTNGSKETS